jgi:hypothetical protein
MDIRSQMVVEARPQPTKREGEAARVWLEKGELCDMWRGRERNIMSNEMRSVCTCGVSCWRNERKIK